MTEKVKELLVNRDFLIPRLLFFNYRKLNISSDEVILLIYFINCGTCFNLKRISDDMGMSLNDVMSCIDSLSSKGFIKFEVKKNSGIRDEHVNLSGLYDKLSCLIIGHEEKKESNIYSIFEEKFGRTITTTEYQIISAWLDSGIGEETILLALDEATYNHVDNLRYIDKILSEWEKKGIKTLEDVEKSRMNFKKKKEVKSNDILEYDWLNDE